MVDPAASRTQADSRPLVASSAARATSRRRRVSGDQSSASSGPVPGSWLELRPERVGPVLDRAGQRLAVGDRRVERREVGVDQGGQRAPAELAEPVDVRGEVRDPLVRGREAGADRLVAVGRSARGGPPCRAGWPWSRRGPRRRSR